MIAPLVDVSSAKCSKMYLKQSISGFAKMLAESHISNEPGSSNTDSCNF